MQINEQELAEAVERLREGEAVLGLTDVEVMVRMTSMHGFTYTLMKMLSDNESPQVFFEEKFDEKAGEMLREAYRTKLELEAGL